MRETTYCNVDSLGISSSLCALDDLSVDDSGVDAVGFKPVSTGLRLCNLPVLRLGLCTDLSALRLGLCTDLPVLTIAKLHSYW